GVGVARVQLGVDEGMGHGRVPPRSLVNAEEHDRAILPASCQESPWGRGSGSLPAGGGDDRSALAGEEAGVGEPALLGVVGEDERAALDLVDDVVGDLFGEGGAAPAAAEAAVLAGELGADVGRAVDDDRALAGTVV